MSSILVVSALADATMVVIELHELSKRIYVRWSGNVVFYISWYSFAIAPNHDMAPEVPSTPKHGELTRDQRLQVHTLANIDWTPLRMQGYYATASSIRSFTPSYPPKTPMRP